MPKKATRKERARLNAQKVSNVVHKQYGGSYYAYRKAMSDRVTKQLEGSVKEIYRNDRINILASSAKCKKCEYKFGPYYMESKTALVKTVDGEPAIITVYQCKICFKYYLDFTSFKSYQKKYGRLDFKPIFDSKIPREEIVEFLHFNNDSFLSRHGYNVREDTPISERHRILSEILDTGEASKNEIVSYLNWFILMGSSRIPDACERWEEDIDFVNNYRIEDQEVVEGLHFYRKDPLRRGR